MIQRNIIELTGYDLVEIARYYGTDKDPLVDCILAETIKVLSTIRAGKSDLDVEKAFKELTEAVIELKNSVKH